MRICYILHCQAKKAPARVCKLTSRAQGMDVDEDPVKNFRPPALLDVSAWAFKGDFHTCNRYQILCA